MFKSILRFVGIIAFIGAFTSSAFAACGANQYAGYDGSCENCPTKANGTDYSANTGLDQFIKTCGGGTFECEPYAYKYRDYNQFGCVPCPKISGNSEGHLDTGFWSISRSSMSEFPWSTTERCTLEYNDKTHPDNGCKYIKVKPSTCSYVSLVSLPDRNNTVDFYNNVLSQWSNTSGFFCDWYAVYSKAVPGYYLANSDTQCLECPAGKYQDTTRYVTACTSCPMMVYNGTPMRGTTTPPATSSSACYINGENVDPITDSTGTYLMGSGVCNWSGGSGFHYTLCPQDENMIDSNYCTTALGNFCGNVLNLGQGCSGWTPAMQNYLKGTNCPTSNSSVEGFFTQNGVFNEELFYSNNNNNNFFAATASPCGGYIIGYTQ